MGAIFTGAQSPQIAFLLLSTTLKKDEIGNFVLWLDWKTTHLILFQQVFLFLLGGGLNP